MDPDNLSATKTWSSIDIFLFSNGQDYSPPRKYHLLSEEIQWWGNTLNYLGRTHYGSGHSSIDLYTIDGTKINGPLELINGAAYVAVEPPDIFNDTGYEQYLLRASRSRDKRVEQKLNSVETANSENKEITADENASPDENIIIKTAKIDNDLINSPLKMRGVKPQKSPSRKSIISVKPIQKNKFVDTHIANMKKICSESDKIFPCPKKKIRNEVTNRKRSSLVTSKPNLSEEQSLNKRNSKKMEKDHITTRQSITKSTNLVGSLRNSLVPYENNYNLNTETQNIDLNSTVADKDTPRVSVYSNEEINQTLNERNLKSNQITNNAANHQQVNNFTEEHLRTDSNFQDSNRIIKQETLNKLKAKQSHDHVNNDILLNDNFTKNKDKNLNSDFPDNKDIFSNNPINFAEKQVTDEYIAYLNKGGLLLLKFNIRIKDCKTIFNKDKTKNHITTTTSLTNMFKSEKTSQVDIDVNFSGEFLNTNDEQVHNHSIQSLLNTVLSNDPDHRYVENPRIIVVQCACQNYTETNRYDRYNNVLCGCNEERKPKQREIVKRFCSCDCYSEIHGTLRDDLENNFTEAASAKLDKSHMYKSNGTHVKHLAQKFEHSDKIKPNEIIGNDLLNDGKQWRNNGELQYVDPAILNEPTLETDLEKKVVQSKFITVCDKSTQTDWCNVLLEARQHEDNKYTFHLPSLFVLKQCDL